MNKSFTQRLCRAHVGLCFTSLCHRIEVAIAELTQYIP